MNAARIATPALLALAMMVPLLAGITPASAFPISTEGLSIITSQDGAGAPYGEKWQTLSETLTVYPHLTNARIAADENTTIGLPTTSSGIPACESIPVPPGGTGCVLAPVATLNANTLKPTMQQSIDPLGAVAQNGVVAFLPGDVLAFENSLGSGGAPTPTLDVRDDLTIQRIQAGFYGSSGPTGFFRLSVFVRNVNHVCQDGASPPEPVPGTQKIMEFELRAQNEYNDPTATVDSILQAPSNYFFGEHDLGLLPVTLHRGESLCYQVTYDTDGIIAGDLGLGIGALFMDSPTTPSMIKVYGDSTRVNTWTANKIGEPVVNFPHADNSVTSDRRVTFNAWYFNAWGNQDCNPTDRLVRESLIVEQPMTPSDQCEFDNLDQSKLRIWVKDLTPGHATQGSYLCLDQGLGLQCKDPSADPYYGRYVKCCSLKTNIVDTAPIIYDNIPVLGADNEPPGYTEGLGRLSYTFVYGSEFPDGIYQIELHEASENIRALQTFYVGQSGYTFEFAPGEPIDAAFPNDSTSTHTVALGEPTQYVLRLTNHGTNADTYGVSLASPGDGWTAVVSPATVTIGPSGFQDFTVLVTPPAPNTNPGGFAGFHKVIKVSAVSISDNTVKDRYTNTVLTGEIKHDVQLIPSLNALEVRPGNVVNFPVVIRNLGTVKDSFVVTSHGTPLFDPTALDSPSGWAVLVNPSYQDIYAASRGEAIVTLSAPPEAIPGSSFTLFLRATLVIDDTVFDEVAIPVLVRVIDAFTAVTYCSGSLSNYVGLTTTAGEEILENQPTATDAAQAHRCTYNGREFADNRTHTEGDVEINLIGVTSPTGTEAVDQTDQYFDAYEIFRVTVTNTGDRDDSIRLTASWVPPVATDDTDNDGVPDGWRYRILGGPSSFIDPLGNLANVLTDARFGQCDSPQRGTGAAAGFSGEQNLANVNLEKGESQDIYIELYWRPFECANNNGVAPTTVPDSQIRLSFRSQNQDDLRDVEYIKVHLQDAKVVQQDGFSPVSTNSVAAEMGLNVDPNGHTLVGAPLIYEVRGINTGNEDDSLRMRLASTTPGWIHQIIDYAVIPSTGTTVPSTHVRRCEYSPTTVPLNPPTTRLLCQHIGVGDEVRLHVQVTPPTSAKIGDRDIMDFVVESGGQCDASKISTGCANKVDAFQRITTRVSGPFLFDVVNLGADRDAYLDQVVGLPFGIRNTGEENDVYRITIQEADEAWLPALSAGQDIAVPAGHDFWGFLSVRVPQDLSGGACGEVAQHFRLKIRSLQSDLQGTQSKLLDFFVNVDPCHAQPFLMSSENNQVRSGQVGHFNVTATDQSGAQDMLYYVDPTSLPPGYRIVCDLDRDIVVPFEVATEPPGNCVSDNCFGDQPPCVTSKPQGQGYPERDFRLFTPSHLAIGNYHIQTPEGELATSRVIVRIRGQADTGLGDGPYPTVYHDAVMNLASIYGIQLIPIPDDTTLGDGSIQVISPGTGVGVVYNIAVVNPGLSRETVQLGASTLPAGWNIAFTPSNIVTVEPGQFEIVTVVLKAPLASTVGTTTTFLVQATVKDDPSKVYHLELKAVVGKASFAVDSPDRGDCPQNVCYLAPQESVDYAVHITNNPDDDGSGFPDYANVEVVLPPALKDAAKLEWVYGCDSFPPLPIVLNNQCQVGGATLVGDENRYTDLIQPGETRTVGFRITVPELILARSQIPLSVVVRSGLSILPVTAQEALNIQVLDYIAQDVDGDEGACILNNSGGSTTVPCLGLEYAIDRDRNPVNGYEEFRENLGVPPAGVQTRSADLLHYLSDEARAEKTKDVIQPDGSTRQVLTYVIDVHGCSNTGDGFVDHFLDTTADGLPDVLWTVRPGTPGHQRLNLTKDVTHDGVVEYFLDGDGDGQLDAFFDLVQGEFGCVKPFFFNEDTIIDYLVDLDADGNADSGEPILIGAPGGRLGIGSIVEKADMDGDGKLDTVLDTDADGNPDNWVPDGKQSSIKIVVRDVTGDGKADWTYSHTGSGDPDSYYDPACAAAKQAKGQSTESCSGFIDTRSEFLRSLEHYWYVGALFVFALVLFAILVAVTRK